MTENNPEQQTEVTQVPAELVLRAQLEEAQRHVQHLTQRCVHLNIGQQLAEAAHTEEVAALRAQLDDLRRLAAGRTVAEESGDSGTGSPADEESDRG